MTDLDIAPPFDMPQWLPRLIRGYIFECAKRDISADEWAILECLCCDPRMRTKMQYLLRKDRTGEYLSPAKQRQGEPQDAAQERAIAEFFHMSFCAVRDRTRTWRRDEVEARRAALLKSAEAHQSIAERENDEALELMNIATGLQRDGRGIWAQRLFAMVRRHMDEAAMAREQADRLLAIEWDMPRGEDPLIVERYRSDSHIQGVQTLLSASAVELFGKPLDNLCATFAAVALGRATSGDGAHQGDATRSVSRRRRRAAKEGGR